MLTFKKILKWIIIFGLSAYLFICGMLYFFQESLMFVPKKLPSDFVYQFDLPHEEINVNLTDGNKINGLLFKADSSKGLVFYLHGNAGALDSWGNAAETYVNLHYDFFVIDYRGYGKSEGKITNEEEFHNDIQQAYNLILKLYSENEIIIAGYSIGTGPATYLAANNSPKMLLLQAPYFNLTELALSQYPFLPPFLLKYKFETSALLPRVKAPVTIFHGEADNLITIHHAYKLEKLFKPVDKLVVLEGLGHNGMNFDEGYKKELAELFSQ